MKKYTILIIAIIKKHKPIVKPYIINITKHSPLDDAS